MINSRLLHASALFFFLGFFSCTWDLIATASLGGFTLKIQQGFFLLSFLAILPTILGSCPRNASQTLRTPFSFAILSLGAYYLFSSYRSYFPLKSFLYSGWLLFNFCTIWLSAQLMSRYYSREYFALVAVISAVAQALVLAIDQFAYRFGYNGGFIGFNQDSVLHWGLSRPHAFSFEPSYIASFLSAGAVTAFAFFVHSRRRARPYLFCAFAVLLFAVIAAASRTGWFSLTTGIVIFLCVRFYHSRSVRELQLPWLACALATGLAFFYLSTSQAQRVTMDKQLVTSVATGKDGAGNARLRAYEYALEMAQDTQWLGTGLGASYKYWISTKNTPDVRYEAPFSQDSYGKEVVMSTWGQLLAEGGLPAVILYAFAGFSLIRDLWRASIKEKSPLIEAAFAGAVVFFCFTAFWLGNVARGDVWVWFAIWSRMALPDVPEKQVQLS